MILYICIFYILIIIITIFIIIYNKSINISSIQKSNNNLDEQKKNNIKLKNDIIDYKYSIFNNIIDNNFNNNKIKNYFNNNKIKNYFNLNKIIDYDYINNKKKSCCLINKQYLKDDNGIFKGDFKYEYKLITNDNDKCNPELYRSDLNQQLLVDEENNWSNLYCNNNNNNIGSCRNINKECIDFVDKQFCNKYNMIWSDKTCHDKLDYKWIDKIINNINIKK